MSNFGQRVQKVLTSQLFWGIIIGIFIASAIRFIDTSFVRNIVSNELFWGFILGIIGTYITSFTKQVAVESKAIKNAEEAIVRSISHFRLKRYYRIDDPHWVIRTTWAACLRDLDSKKSKDIDTALTELESMADLLEPDEKALALEALRLKIGTRKSRDAVDKFVEVMKKLG